MAELLHRNDAAFIPPFPGSIAKQFSVTSVFSKHHGTLHGFVAKRDGQAVGRIAAIINRSHNTYYSDRTGFFGFFDCEDNTETASALIKAAIGVLVDQGMTALRGPYNPSINDECGLLVDAFDLPPPIGMTWNPPYYQKLLETAGLKSVRRMFGMNLPVHRLDHPARLGKIVDKIAKRSRLTLRPMKIDQLEEELAIVREVYNATLERNWGFVPISLDDLLGAADDIRAIADPKLLLIAEMDGKTAGVAITLPNFNEILARIKTTPHWLRLPHIFWLMKTQKINSCRQAVLGVLPECRDRGLHAWLIHEQFVRAKEHFANAALGWMEEDNVEILKNCEIVGGKRNRTWEIFEMPIGD